MYSVWHLATPFLVFFSFLDSTISGHVTQIFDSYVTGKLRLPGYRFFRGCQILEGSDKFSQSYDRYKILICKLASGHALTCFKALGRAAIKPSLSSPPPLPHSLSLSALSPASFSFFAPLFASRCSPISELLEKASSSLAPRGRKLFSLAE